MAQPVRQPRQTAHPLPANLTLLSDDALMLLAKRGTHRAFEQLVARHRAHALRSACHLLGSAFWAADVVQDTFVLLFRSIQSYEPRDKFNAYLYKLLVRQCRSVKRHQRVCQRWWATVATLHSAVAPTPTVFRSDVLRALSSLPREQREAVVLRDAAGCSYDEAAEALAIPLGTAKSRVCTGRKNIRCHLRGR